MSLRSCKIFVTGASSGIGAHLARALARRGAAVAAGARRAEALADLAAVEPRITPVKLDVTDPGSVRSGVAAAAEALGGLDGLVNNAGIAWGGRALDMAEDDWARVIDTNLSGVFRVAQAAARVMAEDGGGSIVNTASVLGFGTGTGVAAYAASKAAVVHLTRNLALEWARHGVRVNALAPGYIPTEINRGFLEGEAGQAMLKDIPMRRFGRPEDLEAPLELLLGPGGAYITGVTLPVDGGHLCRPL
ncbi:glucose 1-dehydrogenase [Paralimibaculum aggregatum]|uniref:Glucose 1-dehydrogenase n=1 Tax=Paralimibaculum aggregatum TaxID=3036245 RepID=A0ABQ6LEK7_9RHOB|nr:SDR family oxidoreductase [Limibaculum sp. NKW23]GMG81780.1 glucose 1-dehydrogenase [Limibaculum sp. NKW23]